MSDQTLKLVAALRARIESTRRRITLLEALAGLLITLGAALGLWFLSISMEAGFWLPTGIRIALLSILGILVAFLAALFIVLPLLRFAGWFGRFTEQHVARLVGRRFPEVSDRMTNFLQLTEGAHSVAPAPMLDRAVKELGSSIEPVPFEGVASADRVRRYARLALVPLAAILVFAGASPGTFIDASQRMLSPRTTFTRPVPFSIRVSPGDMEVVRGDSVLVTAAVSGTGAPEGLSVEYEFEGEIRTRFESIEADENGVHSHLFPALRQSLRYRVSGPPVVTDWFRITVVERPAVQRLDVTLHAPTYTRLPVQELETNVGDIAALAGTRADFRIGVAGSDVEFARLVFDDGATFELSVDGQTAAGSITIGAANRYRIELESPAGIRNADPIAYEITVLRDAEPTLSILYPEPVSEISEEARMPFAVRFSDDFGFSSLALHYRVAESRFGTIQEEFSSLALPIADRYLLDQIFEDEWLLREDAGLDPVPGDAIEYYLRVLDNDRVSGFKEAISATHTLRFPSLVEQYDQLDAAEDGTEEALEKLLEEARGVRDQFQTLKEDLRQKPESNWQDERRLEQIQQQQEELESSVEEISRSIEEFTEEMSRNDLVSEETVSLFEELREVVDEVNTPELMEALRNLENALQNMDPNEMQQSLEDFEFNEEQYMERLDRALELFKNLRLQQDMEEAQRRAGELAELEDRLQEETAALRNEENSRDDQTREGVNPEDDERRPGEQDPEQRNEERLAAEQDQAAQEMEGLERKLEEIRERMEELNAPTTRSMQDLEEDTKDREIPQQMQRAAEELREKEFQQAQENQQNVQQQLQNLQGQLGDMEQNMQGQQLQMNLSGLRSTLSDILTLSERQESLRLEVAAIRSEGPQLRTAAQRQVELSEGLSTVSDSLAGLARKIPQMSRDVQQESGEALREMASAVDELTDRASRNASGHQKGAMTHLNELALILSELLDQMSNSSASSGQGMSMEQLMQQLQQMGEQQQNLNDQIQQILNDSQGNRLTTDMIERMRQLGAQQDQIRRDLKQINRDRTARNKLLGDLNRLAEQMEESAQELMQNRTSRQLMQRQRQILTRLLEASRSLREQGRERERESRTGTDLDRMSPPDLTPAEQIEQLRRELFRALESGYSSDYEQLIRRYFELLQQQSETGS